MKYILPAVSVILLILVISGAAFYFGQKSVTKTQTAVKPTPNIAQQNAKPTTIATQTPTQAPIQTSKTVTAGGVLVFSTYSLSLPSDWTSTHNTGQNMDTLTLINGDYKIVISQAAGGGGGCTYPGQAPQEMAQSFYSFVEITNPNGFVFRRGPTQQTPDSWTVCQKNATDGSFGFPTNFGNITITTPASPSDAIMAEVDAVLASLKKQ